MQWDMGRHEHVDPHSHRCSATSPSSFPEHCWASKGLGGGQPPDRWWVRSEGGGDTSTTASDLHLPPCATLPTATDLAKPLRLLPGKPARTHTPQNRLNTSQKTDKRPYWMQTTPEPHTSEFYKTTSEQLRKLTVVRQAIPNTHELFASKIPGSVRGTTVAFIPPSSQDASAQTLMRVQEILLPVSSPQEALLITPREREA